jgi:hypothetical protein
MVIIIFIITDYVDIIAWEACTEHRIGGIIC